MQLTHNNDPISRFENEQNLLFIYVRKIFLLICLQRELLNFKRNKSFKLISTLKLRHF